MYGLLQLIRIRVFHFWLLFGISPPLYTNRGGSATQGGCSYWWWCTPWRLSLKVCNGWEKNSMFLQGFPSQFQCQTLGIMFLFWFPFTSFCGLCSFFSSFWFFWYEFWIVWSLKSSHEELSKLNLWCYVCLFVQGLCECLLWPSVLFMGFFFLWFLFLIWISSYMKLFACVCFKNGGFSCHASCSMSFHCVCSFKTNCSVHGFKISVFLF